MFIVGGFNVYPAEIENALARHPAIAEAAVIGVPDERLGEVGMAFIVLQPDASSFARGDRRLGRVVPMANYKAPGGVEFVANLPRNATGKVVKQRPATPRGPRSSLDSRERRRID